MIDANIELFIGPMGKMRVGANAGALWWDVGKYWMIDANIELFIGSSGKMGIGADIGALWWGPTNIGRLMQKLKYSLARWEKWASVQMLAQWGRWAFGRMYVVALLYHSMCLEQFEDIYLAINGSLDGYSWSLAKIWICIECALAHASAIHISMVCYGIAKSSLNMCPHCEGICL